jgi:hypothetical protein
MLMIHLENEGRNARVGLSLASAEKALAPLEQVTVVGKISRIRALNGQVARPPSATTSAALIDGDPELDLRAAGRFMGDATLVHLDPDPGPDGQSIIATEFKEVEVVYSPDGQEKERRSRVFRTANVDTTAPLKIVRRLPVQEGLTRFVFRTVHQLVHTDGLNFDFLHGLAKSLQDRKEMALLGAGPKGNGPLVLRDGGTQSRGFLYGEAEGEGETARYRLLLLLSEQELKTPPPPTPPA